MNRTLTLATVLGVVAAMSWAKAANAEPILQYSTPTVAVLDAPIVDAPVVNYTPVSIVRYRQGYVYPNRYVRPVYPAYRYPYNTYSQRYSPGVYAPRYYAPGRVGYNYRRWWW